MCYHRVRSTKVLRVSRNEKSSTAPRSDTTGALNGNQAFKQENDG